MRGRDVYYKNIVLAEYQDRINEFPGGYFTEKKVELSEKREKEIYKWIRDIEKKTEKYRVEERMLKKARSQKIKCIYTDGNDFEFRTTCEPPLSFWKVVDILSELLCESESEFWNLHNEPFISNIKEWIEYVNDWEDGVVILGDDEPFPNTINLYDEDEKNIYSKR